MEDDSMSTDAILLGMTIALKLLETASNVAVARAEMNAIVGAARAEGRDITLAELQDLARGNQELTDEVLLLLGKPRI